MTAVFSSSAVIDRRYSYQPPLCLRLDRHFQVDVDWSLFFGQGATQLRQRDILQLANAFARHPKFLPDLLQRLGLAAIESEARENNFAFAIVEHFEQTAYFVTQIFVAQQLERRHRFLVADDFTKLSRIIIADWRIQ